ncbi:MULTISPECIES: hypothetical protein [unclassified Janthinobacterium]|uniref:hypothetical protein n=1 Tax=unclassified Janthinobacterium TaxID=2610881 RepID=UPI00034B6FE4|nr:MULTISPECIES: hypothetical protein [unclassified Janthinobacterium]MEC5160691.1 hypothetical protein [Janthinobacterium sp. CG_S6]
MDVQQAILLAALETFDELGVTASNPAYHVVLDKTFQQAAAPAPRPRAVNLELPRCG